MTNDTPTFVSLRKLTRLLGAEQSEVLALSTQAPRYYRPFPKKKGDKVRFIDRPIGPLKELQYRIYARLLRPLAYPDFLHGGVCQRSPKTNAEKHLARKYVVRIDIREFFRSITNTQVFGVWRDLGYSPRLARLLTKLTTYRGYLPQGAPTSSALANLVLLPADRTILNSLDGGTVYTRFVDDLSLSGDYPQRYINGIVSLLRGSGFRTKHKKLVVKSSTKRQELTGYVLNSAKGPSKARSYRSAVRAAIHQLGLDKTALDRQTCSIRGKVQHIGLTNRGAAKRLNRHLEQQCARIQSKV